MGDIRCLGCGEARWSPLLSGGGGGGMSRGVARPRERTVCVACGGGLCCR